MEPSEATAATAIRAKQGLAPDQQLERGKLGTRSWASGPRGMLLTEQLLCLLLSCLSQSGSS